MNLKNKSKISIVCLSLLLMTALLAVGCNKIDRTEDEVKVYKPNIVKYEISNPDILLEVDKVLNYIYLGDTKPTGEYMKSIDKQLDELNNQRYYLADFFEELKKLQEEFDDYDIDSENVTDDSTYFGDDYVEGEVEWETEEYNPSVENSYFILTDEEGNDYIDINELEFFNDGVYFTYNNLEYMLDMSKFKTTLNTIRLMEKNYKLAIAKEEDIGKVTAVYIDSKTGDGKTVTILYEGNTITFIDIEI